MYYKKSSNFKPGLLRNDNVRFEANLQDVGIAGKSNIYCLSLISLEIWYISWNMIQCTQLSFADVKGTKGYGQKARELG